MGGLALSDELSQMCKRFEEAEETTRPSRERAERDRDYFDEKQWTATEEAALRDRNQPVVTYNRIKRKINSLTGLEKQTRKDPKAFPRNPQDEASAHAATDAIRYVCDDSRWDDKRSEAFKDLTIEGTGIVMVGVKQTRQGIDPDIRRIPWDRFFHDPHSSEFDFSDANYLGIVIWSDYDDLLAKNPGKEAELEATLNTAASSDTYDDKPKHALWADRKRKRIRVVEMYYLKNGKWTFCIFTKGGFLVKPQPSPYLGDDKQPECPLKAVSLYVDRDNNRYGEVRTMIGPQDEVNKRRSKALHLISERQVRVSRTVGTDAEAVRRELSNPRGVFIGDKDEVEILPTNDMAMANLQMLQEAKNEIDMLGPNAAMQGKNQQEMSGRAIIAQQQGGMLESATLLDRIRCLSLAVYRSVWCRIQQHWTAERWIRVTDNEKNVRFVGLNRPVTGLEIQAKKMGVTQDNFEQFAQQSPEQAQQLAMFAQTPQAQQVVSVENSVVELDVDITIDEGIDTPTVAAEQFDTIAKMIPAAPPNIQGVLWEAMFRSSALRDKEQILEKLEQGPSPEQIQQQQQMQQLQIAGATAEVKKTEAEGLLTAVKAQTEQARPMIEGVKAGMRPGADL
jgi:hypothetical protein